MTQEMICSEDCCAVKTKGAARMVFCEEQCVAKSRLPVVMLVPIEAVIGEER